MVFTKTGPPISRKDKNFVLCGLPTTQAFGLSLLLQPLASSSISSWSSYFINQSTILRRLVHLDQIENSCLSWSASNDIGSNSSPKCSITWQYNSASSSSSAT